MSQKNVFFANYISNNTAGWASQKQGIKQRKRKTWDQKYRGGRESSRTTVEQIILSGRGGWFAQVKFHSEKNEPVHFLREMTTWK